MAVEISLNPSQVEFNLLGKLKLGLGKINEYSWSNNIVIYYNVLAAFATVNNLLRKINV